MSKLSVGSEFPKGVKFAYIPYSPESADVKTCGAPIQLNADTEFANKKVVLVAVPGAFTPTCMNNHIPPYGEKLDQLKQKGVDEVIVISANDPFVLSAWAKVLGLNDKIKFASDPNAAFAKSVGLSLDGTALGLQTRTLRFAAVINNGKVDFLNVEPDPTQVTNTSVDDVLAAL